MSTGARVAFFGAFAVLALFLWSVRTILTPFAVAIILAYVLNPVVERLCTVGRMRRGLAVGLIYLVLGLLLGWGVFAILPLFTHDARDLVTTAPRLLHQFRRMIDQEQPISVLGVQFSLAPIADDLSRTLAGYAAEASGNVLDFLVHTLELVLKMVITLVATFYLLMGAPGIGRFARRWTPPALQAELTPVLQEIDDTLGRFVRGQLLLICVMSSVTWVALTALGVNYALILALVAGVLEMIPLVGPIAAAVPAVIIAFVQPSAFGWSPAINAGAVALVYFVLRHVEDYFVIPQVLGRALHVHPLMAMFAAFSGAALGGVLGMFLGIPLIATLQIIARYAYIRFVGQPVPLPEEEAVQEVAVQPAQDAKVAIPSSVSQFPAVARQ